MKKIRLSTFLAVVMIIMLTACSSSNETKNISKMLGIDCSDGTISQSTDSHGGFHGDGSTYIEIKFDDTSGKTVAQEIENLTAWNELPLTDNLNTVVYGKESPSASIGPYVVTSDGEPLFSTVTNGYYFFHDRHSESKDAKDDTDLFSRSSFNFTIALYDADTQTLYYFELDT